MKNKMAGLQCGNYSLGDRNLQGGDYDKITSMGNFVAQDAHIHELNALGATKCTDCHIDVLKVAGELTAYGGRIDVASVAGKLILNQSACGSLNILGELCSSASTCRILRYGNPKSFGLFVFSGKHRNMKAADISGETLENFFPLILNGQQHFQTIINCGKLYAQSEIECVNFFNFSLLSASEINADLIYLYPCANVLVKELHGTLVIIDPSFDTTWLKGVAMDLDERDLRNQEACRMVEVDCIEADEVVLDYVKCRSVRAKRVIIGPHAKVDCVEYEERCEIHENAIVKEKIQL